MDGHQGDVSDPSVSSNKTSMNGSSSSSSHHASSPSAEAGPSRLRSSSITEPVRPSSPETVFPARPSTPHLDLATYPTTDLLRLLAQLLQHIAESNDSLRPDLEDMEEDTTDTSASQPDSDSRSSSHYPHHPSPTTALFHADHAPPPSTTPMFDDPLPLFTASKASLGHSSSLLAFHARHVPSISIEAYLLRILKYCPTTNEVFLGLLVYFDRMSRLGTPAGVGGEAKGARKGVGRGFAIDSYNVHRLVIAGVTVASKFFSDVFYTNSRYAKVGGLPPHELNQLELQFLLLNDFRLVIPPEEMQRYGDRLLGYWEDQEDRRAAEAKQAEIAKDVAKKSQQGMEVDEAERHNTDAATEALTSQSHTTSTEPAPSSKPSAPISAPPTSVAAPGAASQPHTPPRGRERESRPGSAVSFAEPPRSHHTHGGLRSWVAGTVGSATGTVGGEVMSGRVASPMRD